MGLRDDVERAARIVRESFTGDMRGYVAGFHREARSGDRSLAYRIHYVEEFGWVVEMTRGDVPVWRQSGYSSRMDAAADLALILGSRAGA